jgi:CheY-like chemotaxis protein
VRVLVADDNDTNLLVAEAMLTALGAQVVTVSDGDEAVAALRDGAYDLVLLDNVMARMSGPDAACAIRALPGPAGRTRLVALTASVTDDDRERFRSAGMDEVLLKPVQLAELQTALDGVARC